jgi:hypothetical protein
MVESILSVEIKDNQVICPQTNESIDIDKLNLGLSNFYGKKVSITNDNLFEFEGDIIALCFGFELEEDNNKIINS